MNPVYLRPRDDTGGTRTKVLKDQQQTMAPGDILELVGDSEDKEGLVKHHYRFRLDDPFAIVGSAVTGPTTRNFPTTVEQTVQWLGSRLPPALRSSAQEACRSEGIDGAVLLTMSEEEVKTILGVTRFGDRRKLMLEIAKLRGPQHKTANSQASQMLPPEGGTPLQPVTANHLSSFGLSRRHPHISS